MPDYQKCYALIHKDAQYIAPCQHAAQYPLVVEKAKGSIVWDLGGNRYIDFLSSASSLNIGSAHPAVTRAIQKQLRKTTQYTAAYTYNKPSVDYAQALALLYPGKIDVKVCFVHCGSDANDTAVKFARAYTGRKNILVFKNGYHGASYGSASLTSWRKDFYEQIDPMLPGVLRMPFYASGQYDQSAEKLESELRALADPETIAAVIMEPIQGEGGMLPADPVFMQQLFTLCKKNGILFFSEEVQQGFYRTGKFFSIEHYGIIPDGVIIGKSAGAGLPLGALIGKKEIMDALPPMANVFTLAANQLACAAGLAQLRYMQSACFQKSLKQNIALSEDTLCFLQKKYPNAISFVRQCGMSIGIGLQVCGRQTAEECAAEIVSACHRKGLIILSLGNGILRIQPPLNIHARELKEGFRILEEAIDESEEGCTHAE